MDRFTAMRAFVRIVERRSFTRASEDLGLPRATVTDAINRGAIYRFLTKPWNDDELRKHIHQAFRTYEEQRRSNAGPAPVESGDGGEDRPLR